MDNSLNRIALSSVRKVYEAHELDTNFSRGIYCKILTDKDDIKWMILSGARLSETPNGSLITNANYARAYANYQNAIKLTMSGVLQEHYVLPKGSESQCLTILQGTPSSKKHAKGHIRKLSNEEVENLFRDRRIENYRDIADTRSPEEIPTIGEEFPEGTSTRVEVNRYERDPRARSKCIAHWGPLCQVCSFSFAKTYGYIGEGFIHVHHIKPISEIGEHYKADPVKELIPVCPNCHAMLHKTTPPLSIEELKEKLENAG